MIARQDEHEFRFSNSSRNVLGSASSGGNVVNISESPARRLKNGARNFPADQFVPAVSSRQQTGYDRSCRLDAGRVNDRADIGSREESAGRNRPLALGRVSAELDRSSTGPCPASMSSGIAMSHRICAMLSALLFLAINTERADAGCVCQCVDGQMQPLCQSSIDVPPVCPAAVCPIAVPSIAPIKPAIIPPIGTTQCRQARVCDTFGNCQWQQVCR